MTFIDDFMDSTDFGILYDVIEFYGRRYHLNATEAVKCYRKERERDLIISELYGDIER